MNNGHESEAQKCDVCGGTGTVNGPCPNPKGRNICCLVRHLVPCPSCQPTEPQAKEEIDYALEKVCSEVVSAKSHEELLFILRQLLSRSHAQGYEEGVRASLEALPEKDESDGWEEFFDRKNVGVCCPGDDLANGWNAARAAISALLTQGEE